MVDRIQFLGGRLNNFDFYGFLHEDGRISVNYTNITFAFSDFKNVFLNNYIDDKDVDQFLRNLFSCLLTQIPFTSKVLGVERAKVCTFGSNQDWDKRIELCDTIYDSKFKDMSNIEIYDSIAGYVVDIAKDVDRGLFA